MTTIIIGISGKARSGKGSCVQLAQILMQKGDDEAEVRQVSFATALKEIARAQGWDGKKDAAGRKLLQDLGMEKRAEDPFFWIREAFRRIEDLRPVPQVVFVPDCRFLNEVEAIRACGGKIWRVNRVNEDGTPYDNQLTLEQKAHASEVQLDNYEFDAILEAADMKTLFCAAKVQLKRLGLI